MSVDTDGMRHVLEIWVQSHEGAKFWAGVSAELANCGTQDVLIVPCDGLTGFLEAIDGLNQVRVYKNRRAVSAKLKKVYTAVNEESAQCVFEAFSQGQWGAKYPFHCRYVEAFIGEVVPFFVFGANTRRTVPTNAIESLIYQLRKIIKAKGRFPSDQAAIKLSGSIFATSKNAEHVREQKAQQT